MKIALVTAEGYLKYELGCGVLQSPNAPVLFVGWSEPLNVCIKILLETKIYVFFSLFFL